jgi:hypothetical protein
MPWLRTAGLTILVVFSGIQLSYGIQKKLNPSDAWDYTAAAEFLANHTTSSTPIVGAAELAFARGFDGPLIDDPRLGYYSGKRPDFIAANSFYRAWFVQSEIRDPEIHTHIRRVLSTEYRPVFRNTSYTIYQRKVR